MEIGDCFGKWTVVEILTGGRVKVQCECGKIDVKRIYDLKRGSTKQCYECRYHKKKPIKKNNQSTTIKTNMRFGAWIIVDENDFKIIERNGEKLYRVRCDCGIESYVRVTFLTSGRSLGCKSCRDKRIKRESNRKNFVGDISKSVMTTILQKAKERNLVVEINQEYLWKLFCKQSGECAFTKIPLSFGQKHNDTSGRTASLDRIDSSKGYIEGNVQWVHKEINRMKGNLSNKSFIDLCRSVFEASESLDKQRNHVLNSHLRFDENDNVIIEKQKH